MNAWRSLGYTMPDIHEEDDVNEVWLTLPLTKISYHKNNKETNKEINKETNKEINKETNKETNKEINKETNKETNKEYLPDWILNKLTDDQNRFVELLYSNPSLTFNQLSDKMGMSVQSLRTLRSNLEKVGIYLKRDGSTKTGKWKIEFVKNLY